MNEHSEMNEDHETPAALVTVRTVVCRIEVECTLSDPPEGKLYVPSPFSVEIENLRECCAGSEVETKMYWSIVGGPDGELLAGKSHTRTMENDNETLQLFYSECDDECPSEYPFVPGPGTTPRITINLTRKREK